MTDVTKAALFYAIALGLAIAASQLGSVMGQGALLLTMITPVVAAVLMLAIFAREPGGMAAAAASLGLDRLGLKGVVPALVVPWMILLAGLAVVAGSGLSAIDLSAISGDGPRLAFKATAGLLIGTLFALGEEIGWRGYMLPRLYRFGAAAAMLLVGFLHGVWHLPLVLTTDLYHASGNVWLVTPMLLATFTLAGVFYGFLRIWTGSVVPVALAHAATNMAWEMTSLVTVSKSPLVTEYVGGETGAVMIGALLVIDIYLIRLLARRGARGTPPLAGPG